MDQSLHNLGEKMIEAKHNQLFMKNTGTLDSKFHEIYRQKQPKSTNQSLPAEERLDEDV